MATANLTLQADAKGFDKVDQQLNSIANSTRFTALIEGLKIVGAMAQETFGKLVAGIQGAVNDGSKMTNISHRLAVGAGDVKVLSKAFEQNGNSVEEMNIAMITMLKNVELNIRAFERLGLSQSKLKSMGAVEQFKTIVEALRNVESQTERVRNANEIFGDTGAKIGQLIESPQAFEDAEKVVGELRNVYNEMAYTMEAVGTKYADLAEKQTQFYAGILGEIAPMLNEILDRFTSEDFTSLGKKIGEPISQALAYYDRITAGFSAILEALKAVGNSFLVIGNALGFAISSLVEGVVKSVEWVTQKIGSLLSSIGLADEDAFKNVDLGGKFMEALTSVYKDAMKENLQAGVNALDEMSRNFVKMFNAKLIKGSKVDAPEQKSEATNAKIEEQEEEFKYGTLEEATKAQVGQSQYFKVGGYASALEASTITTDFSIQQRNLEYAARQLDTQSMMLKKLASIEINTKSIGGTAVFA